MIRRRKDGRWEGRIVAGHTSDGKPIYRSVLANTQSELMPKLNALKETYAGVELNEDSRMTLGEWLDKWLTEYVTFTVRESTLEAYRDLAKNQIKRFIGDKQLTALKTVDVQKLYNKVKNEGRVREHPTFGRTLSDSMVRKVHMVLHQALDAAVREHLIPSNPTNGTMIPKCNYAEKQILCDSQLDTFLEAIEEEKYWHDFFYVEIMTGLRRGEICGLKWSDLDVNTGKLRVQRSVSIKKGGGVNIGETKTDKGVRAITLPQSVIEMLRIRQKTAISEWIFPNLLQPELPISPAAAYRKLKAILKRAELPMIRFHDLRHTFATHAMQGGVDAKTLSGILGHTNASFTLDTYTHVTTDMQNNASEVVSNMMKNIMIR